MAGWNAHQQKIADRILSDCHWLIGHERVEWYTEQRPYQRPPRRPTSGFGGDCTGTIKLVVCDWNVVPPFDGTPSGYGNTQTFYHMPRGYRLPLDPKRWQPLDILLYKHHWGPFIGGPGEHATMLMEKRNGVWYCFSMGSSSGPTFDNYNYRSDLITARRFPIPLK